MQNEARRPRRSAAASVGLQTAGESAGGGERAAAAAPAAIYCAARACCIAAPKARSTAFSTGMRVADAVSPWSK